jgi:hypothetical protein
MSSITSTVASVASSTATAAATCITSTPDKNGHVPLTDCRVIWPYYPSIGAAVLFTVLFGASTITHLVQAIHYRKKFCWVIINAGLWETIGFFLRILSAKNQITLGIYVPEELLIILAPIWINAFDYMLLGRMIYYFLPEQSVLGLKAKRFALLFVLMDMAAFVVQAIGGVMLTGGSNIPEHTLRTGLHVYEAGLGIQEAFMAFFMFLAVLFHRRMLQLEREGTLQKNTTSWRPLLFTLYASLMLITIRIIFRLVQYNYGFLGTIPTHEVYFYALDALPMFLALILMNITHPGRTLVGPESEFPSKTREQKKEEKQAKKAAKEAKKFGEKRPEELCQGFGTLNLHDVDDVTRRSCRIANLFLNVTIIYKKKIGHFVCDTPHKLLDQNKHKYCRSIRVPWQKKYRSYIVYTAQRYP